MTADQFAGLSELAGLRGKQVAEALRLVLVDGLPVGQAAERAGVSQSSASHALARVRKVLELARRVVGLCNLGAKS